MSQLLTPSAALGGAFELPPVATEATQHQSRLAQTPQTLNAYALELCHLGLLLPIDTPSTLVENTLPACRLPHTPHWLARIINWNGITVPVFHLETLLDFEIVSTSGLKTLIIGHGEDAVGLQVTAMPFRITLRNDQKLTRNPPLPQALQAFTRGCYRTEKVWVDWDYRGFFDAVARRF